MSPKKPQRPPGPTFRTELRRAADTFGVASEDLDRALVIGQIAGLLIKDRALRGRLAHKGAAVLRLIYQSQRLSRDLDSGEIRGTRIDPRHVVHALSSAEARKVVLNVTPRRPGENGVGFLLECRGFRGGPAVTITLSINWSEPFVLAPRLVDHGLPGGKIIKVPVMQAVESAAEKVRAFLTRGSANDAYDLWWYRTRVLTPDDHAKLGGLVRRKLASPACRIRADADLHGLYEEMRENAREEWASGEGLVLVGKKPDSTEVDRALTFFKRFVPQRRP